MIQDIKVSWTCNSAALLGCFDSRKYILDDLFNICTKHLFSILREHKKGSTIHGWTVNMKMHISFKLLEKWKQAETT